MSQWEDEHPTTIAFAFVHRADQFWRAYKSAPDDPPFSWPKYFLLCHAVELVIKGFLIAQGVPLRQLTKREWGHHIDRLMDKAVAQDLQISPLAVEKMKQLSDVHSIHRSRYPKEMGSGVFAVEYFEPYVEELLQSVHESLGLGVILPPKRDGLGSD